MIAVAAGCASKKPMDSPSVAHLPNGTGGIHKTGNPYRIDGRWYTPMPYVKSYDETGVASWYGKDFHGNHTANGEIYDMHALSAAHKTLPLPTLVRVTNLHNGKSVIVRVNDRGPFVKDRLIDLSYAAAKALDYDRNGTTHVRVQTLDTPAPSKQASLAMGEKMRAANRANSVHVSAPDQLSLPASSEHGKIFIQLGAFASRANALRLEQRLKGSFHSSHTVAARQGTPPLYRVRIGPFEDMVNIEQTLLSLQKHGYEKPVVVIE